MIKLRNKILNYTIYTVNRAMECSTPFLMPQIIECSGFG